MVIDMNVLGEWLCNWEDGKRVRGIKTPTAETIYELFLFFHIGELETINSDVIDLIKKADVDCKIRNKGIGWEVTV